MKKEEDILSDMKKYIEEYENIEKTNIVSDDYKEWTPEITKRAIAKKILYELIQLF